MAVNGINAPRTTDQSQKLVQRDSDARGSDSALPATGDRIELSPQARQISTLSDAAAALPEIRSERVHGLRLAIADETYRIDSRQLARAILDFEDGING